MEVVAIATFDSRPKIGRVAPLGRATDIARVPFNGENLFYTIAQPDSKRIEYTHRSDTFWAHVVWRYTYERYV
jgi:hypothetical protein